MKTIYCVGGPLDHHLNISFIIGQYVIPSVDYVIPTGNHVIPNGYHVIPTGYYVIPTDDHVIPTDDHVIPIQVQGDILDNDHTGTGRTTAF